MIALASQIAYRVVQEGLTNALRYASGAAVAVRLADGGGELVVEVSNGPAPNEDATLAGSGTGNGLRGLRERVTACGGKLSAGPATGGWRLCARLPRVGRGQGDPPAAAQSQQVSESII